MPESESKTLPDVESDDPKHKLFLMQKHTLDSFLERGAISKEQYSKSLHDMAEKMGFSKEIE